MEWLAVQFLAMMSSLYLIEKTSQVATDLMCFKTLQCKSTCMYSSCDVISKASIPFIVFSVTYYSKLHNAIIIY